MLAVETCNRFEKDLARLKKRGKNLSKLENIVEKLRISDYLVARNRPHILSGDWAGF